jgi:hypothetical protein
VDADKELKIISGAFALSDENDEKRAASQGEKRERATF